jgi:uncharacterized membrane protein
MKDQWEANLRTLEMMQTDLRRRLENLDRQIAELRSELAGKGAESDSPELPEVPAENPSVRPPPLPAEIRPRSEAMPRFDTFAEARPSESVFPPPEIPAEKPAPPSRRPAAPKTNLELKVGQYWLVRIGILVLLTGLVLLGNLAYHSVIVKLGAPGKLAMLYLAGAALAGLGGWLERRMAGVRNYARVLMAGGAATIYYTTYAAHFVPGLQVITSPLIGGGALLLLAGGLTWIATRRKVEGIAFTAVLLSYYTSAINPAANFTLFSNVVLTAVAGFLLARHRWSGVSWLSLAGSYASFAYWRIHSGAPEPETFWFSHGFLLAYWVIFTGAIFLHRGGAFQSGHREVFLTANNLAFFALFAPAFQAVYPREFWLFAMVLGALLLALSQLARRLRGDDLSFDGAYLAQGLIALAVGLVTKFTGYQLGVILIVESTALLWFSKFRHALLLRTASGLTAAGATLLALVGFFRPEPHPWLAAVFIALLLVCNAVLLKRLRGEWPALGWHWGAAGFAWAGQLVFGVVLLDRFSGDGRFWIYAAVAAVTVFSLRLHRLPELAVGAQGFVFSSLLALLPAAIGARLGWQNAPAVLGIALALMHWWQWKRVLSAPLHLVWESLNALAACAVLYLWLSPDWQSDGQMLPLALTGLGVLAYSIVTGAGVLAVFSQGFTLAAAGLCFRALIWGEAPWTLTLGVIVLIAAQAGAARLLPAARRAELAELLIGYRLMVLALVVAWQFEYVPERWIFLVPALSGALIFIPAALRRNPEFLAHAAVFIAAGAVSYGAKLLKGDPGSGADFLALILVLAVQQAGKKWLSGTPYFPAGAQATLAVAALGGIWFQASRWVWDGSGTVAVTVIWAGLAFAALGAGFLLRERIYRLMGLLILAVAVGHVFFVDVWKLGQLAGILGILGLAVVLLALGFLYNRFAEEIKKWL